MGPARVRQNWRTLHVQMAGRSVGITTNVAALIRISFLRDDPLVELVDLVRGVLHPRGIASVRDGDAIQVSFNASLHLRQLCGTKRAHHRNDIRGEFLHVVGQNAC